MVGQKLHVRHINQLGQPVKLHALAVVNVDGTGLRGGKVLVIVQPANVPDRVLQLELAGQLAVPPIDHGHVTLATGEQQVPPVARILGQIGPAAGAFQVQLEAAVLGAQWVVRHSDAELARAAQDLIAKIGAVVPERLRPFVF